jgi:PiT family inorganic phosphate transporter
MFAALAASGTWVHLATYLALPVSTTHSIVGAVVGFGMISVGVGAVSWGKVIAITLSWIVSPVAGALIAGSIYHFIQKKIMSSRDPHTAAVHYAPVLIFFVILILILSFIFKGLKNLHLELPFFHTLLLTIPLAALVSLFGRRWVRWQVHLKCELRPNPQGFSPVDCFFAQLQVLTACYVAFAHGANDVANAIGPLAAIFSVIKTKAVALQVEVPIWMLFIGGAAVGGGLFMYGGRIIATIGEKITEITPVRGFAAEFGAATTILIWPPGFNHPRAGWLGRWRRTHAGHGRA